MTRNVRPNLQYMDTIRSLEAKAIISSNSFSYAVYIRKEAPTRCCEKIFKHRLERPESKVIKSQLTM